MVFSDTTNKNGLIQTFEFWSRLPDGEVTGTLLKQVTTRINSAFEKIMPMLLSYSDFVRWDDTNHTDAPIGYTNLISGVSDYKIMVDENSLDILNFLKVRIKPSATATDYEEIQRMSLEDKDVAEAMSPQSYTSGKPYKWLENGNRIFLYPEPDYSATDGIEIFFGREQSYFVDTDTTKEPGIPKPFHELLALYASSDYVSVQRPDDVATLSVINGRIAQKENDLREFIDLRNPKRGIISPKLTRFI